jgi:polyisoprenoid-binding protein YceI
VIDMGTINPTDENYSEDRPKENLVGHLSAPDFFDVANFPTASFVIKETTGSTVSGDLTIRGITPRGDL